MKYPPWGNDWTLYDDNERDAGWDFYGTADDVCFLGGDGSDFCGLVLVSVLASSFRFLILLPLWGRVYCISSNFRTCFQWATIFDLTGDSFFYTMNQGLAFQLLLHVTYFANIYSGS